MISAALSPSHLPIDGGKKESSPVSSEDGTYSLGTVNEEASPIASPTKKRRVSSASVGWQDFCRNGTRFKTLLDDALVKVTNVTASAKEEYTPTNIAIATTTTTNSNPSTTNSSSASSVAILARQKTTECILLQQEIDQIKSEQAQMKGNEFYSPSSQSNLFPNYLLSCLLTVCISFE